MNRFVKRQGAERELLTSDRMLAEMVRRAENIDAAAGPGHRVDSQIGPNRARAAVITDTINAMVREARDRSLTRAIDAGRG